MSLKEKLMKNMMDKQLGSMSSEEKQQMMETMMDNFFSGMSEEEKKGMMQTMMPKMMGNMMGGQGNPMMGMMSMMMNKKSGKQEEGDEKMPMDYCREMMSGFTETANNAKFAAPELRALFNEWCEQIENEILTFVKDKNAIKINELIAQFNLSEESIKYLLGRLAGKNLINFSI